MKFIERGARWAAPLFALVLSIPALAQAAPRATVDTGTLVGISNHGADKFLGVPFAAPPVGDLRWKAPQAAAAWTGDRPAGHSATRCSAVAAGDGPRLVNEDCLYLDVYRPAGAKKGEKLPVMVYFHGGGNFSGSPDIYDGSRMATVGHAVVIIPAYRIGGFGFLALPELSKESPDMGSGNYGVLDEVAALEWVKRNATAFGGNPGDVTVLGQSAGGTNVCDLLISPKTQGLFQRAIIQSGLCQIPIEMAQAEKDGSAYATKVGCADPAGVIACLRAKKADEIVDTWKAAGLGLAEAPIGGALLPLKPFDAFAQGKFNHVPVLVGFARDEWWPFEHGLYPLSEAGYKEKVEKQYGPKAETVLAKYPVSKFPHTEYALGAAVGDQLIICPSFAMADALSANTPVSMYEFADRTVPPFKSLGTPPNLPPGYHPGAFHTGELYYLLAYKPAVRPLDVQQLKLADRMIHLWVDFGRKRPGAKAWPAYDAKMRKVLELDALNRGGIKPSTASWQSHQCDFWSAP